MSFKIPLKWLHEFAEVYSCWLAFCVQSGGKHASVAPNSHIPVKKRRDEGGKLKSCVYCCFAVYRQLRVLVGNLQRAPQSLPGIINIAAILIKWQSRIASHSRGHSAHKSTASMLYVVLNLRISCEYSVVKRAGFCRMRSCRTTGVCLFVTRILMAGYVLRQKRIRAQSCYIFA